tara:strand:+ start:1629 stop:2927 length:1299 start_codon:yes stop_codon:yes gene_type:complete
MKKALLVIDNPYREMRGMFAISQRLKKNGIFSYIVSKNTFNDWFDIFKPNIVILPRATSPFISFIKKNYLNTNIIIIPIEHGSGVKEKVLNHNFGQNFFLKKKVNSAIELASLILVSGENQKEWITDTMPKLSDKIKVVGTLSSDHWFKPMKKLDKTKKIGICTTFKSIFFSSAFNSSFKILYDHLSENYQLNRWRLNFQNYEMHYLGFLYEAIDQLTRAGYEVDIRPHPHENWNGWLQWIKSVKNNKNISLNRDLNLTDWIDGLSVCITTFSTTTFDCISRNVPTISLDKLVKDEIIKLPKNKTPLTGDFSWRPASLDEMKSLINKAQNNELGITPNPKAAEIFMKNNFFWPREKSSATYTVEHILKSINFKMKIKKRTFYSLLKIPLIFIKIIFKDLRDYFFHPRKSNLFFCFSFNVWYSAYKFNKNLKV